MPTLDQHIAARADPDLLSRIIAAAEITGIANPTTWAQANVGRIVATEVNGTSLSEVHAYAVATYDPPPRPGADASKITDALVMAAVDLVEPKYL